MTFRRRRELRQQSSIPRSNDGAGDGDRAGSGFAALRDANNTPTEETVLAGTDGGFVLKKHAGTHELSKLHNEPGISNGQPFELAGSPAIEAGPKLVRGRGREAAAAKLAHGVPS